KAASDLFRTNCSSSSGSDKSLILPFMCADWESEQDFIAPFRLRCHHGQIFEKDQPSDFPLVFSLRGARPADGSEAVERMGGSTGLTSEVGRGLQDFFGAARTG